MQSYNLTLNNYFRNPIRWGRCPMSIGGPKVYGIYLSYGEMLPTTFKKRWLFVIYFYRWYKAWSNYPLYEN